MVGPVIGPAMVSVVPAAASAEVTSEGALTVKGREAGDVKVAVVSSVPPFKPTCGERVTVRVWPVSVGLVRAGVTAMLVPLKICEIVNELPVPVPPVAVFTVTTSLTFSPVVNRVLVPVRIVLAGVAVGVAPSVAGVVKPAVVVYVKLAAAAVATTNVPL